MMKYLYFLSVLFFLALSSCQIKPAFVAAEHKVVLNEPVKAQVFVTARDTALQLSQIADASFGDLNQPNERQVCIFVDPGKSFQTMVGIGGALTDASAEVFAKLPVVVQKELLTAYYDKEKGIGYNFARTNIASCDFSSDSYSYITDNDSLLSTFNVGHDEKFKIPLIKQAILAAGGNFHYLLVRGVRPHG